MAAYATYLYYTDTFLGTAITSEAEFDRLAARASEEIDTYTFDKAAPVVLEGTDLETIDKIQKTTCAVAEMIQTFEGEPDQGLIQSERTGNHQITYVQGGGVSDDQQVESTIKKYLGHTGLMYKGFY